MRVLQLFPQLRVGGMPGELDAIAEPHPVRHPAHVRLVPRAEHAEGPVADPPSVQLRERFQRVDHAYPVAIARHARAAGARAFALNSATGAEAASRIFYNRIKGRLEDDLRAQGWPSLALVRPGLIDGARSESRPGEAIALAVSRVLAPLLPRAWRPSPVARIADALVDAALDPKPGVHVVDAAQLAG